MKNIFICKHPHGTGALKARNCQEIIHFCSFIINPKSWTSATAVTGNVRAVGLPPPACDEWSTMWGETSVFFLEKAKLTKGSFTLQRMRKGLQNSAFDSKGTHNTILMRTL